MSTVSVVVPVRDGEAYLDRTLPPLLAALPPGAELIVSDDASRDRSASRAEALGARVVRGSGPRGPAAARNRGAAEAGGDVLVFLDADVRVHPDTLDRLLGALSDPAVTAAFGSYDDAPPGQSWVSRYKNLSHHFVHQRSLEDASTFWAGCGAVRRDVFRSMGGFDEGYRRASIEDVELGYRLKESGHRIRLVREARVTHLKEWTLPGWLGSDLRDRAIPWARLVRAGRGLPRDLNFTGPDRAATLLVAGALTALATASVVRAELALLAPVLLAGAAAADVRFLRFAARRVSPAFAAGAAGLHLLHRAAAVAGFLVGYLTPEPGAASSSEVTEC